MVGCSLMCLFQNRIYILLALFDWGLPTRAAKVAESTVYFCNCGPSRKRPKIGNQIFFYV